MAYDCLFCVSSILFSVCLSTVKFQDTPARRGLQIIRTPSANRVIGVGLDRVSNTAEVLTFSLFNNVFTAYIVT